MFRLRLFEFINKRIDIPGKISKQDNPPVRLRSQASIEREEAFKQVQGLQRAISCESVNSDTSVGLADLEEPHVTGYLCVGLDYDR